MKTQVYICLFLLLSISSFAQNMSTLQSRKQSLVKHIPFKNVGPSIMSGRVVDIAVNPKNSNEFYVGYASGGVWYTKNNGTSFTPILDSAETQNVGAIAVHWPTQTIWVGSGEVNASRSSYAGIGILKSTNQGKTWQKLGLTDSHHIASILINPNNPNEITVGVTGHLYTPNNERGIYKSLNGGMTWKQTLFIDNLTGIIDIKQSPNSYKVMYAASWTKDRKAWHFNGSGEGSALYKSNDSGNTWTKLTTKTSGFPTGNGVGRIGLTVFNATTLYALLDNQNRRDQSNKTSKKQGLSKNDFKNMSVAEFLNLSDKKLNAFLKTNGFQEKYRSKNVKQMVRNGHTKPIDLKHYLENANSLLFDTPVIGAEVYKSTDGGVTWKKTHDNFIDDLYFSYGYYFGEIRVDPQNENNIYILGVPLLKSKDGGKTFTSISRENVHADHQALWVNPNVSGHLINGNDGGLNLSYDDGQTWRKLNPHAVGQFYSINIDHETPYNIYGGLQDNGVWTGAHNAIENYGWHQNGQYPWKSIMGGDGMQVQIDNRNSNIVYTGYQFGNYFRLNRKTSTQTYIQPKHELGEKPYRFNWQTPILLSPHNQDILYLGGNKLMRSLNQGNNWVAISPDLTHGGKKGNVAYGTITTISESEFQFGLIYTGSDDGLIQITQNGGGNWNMISSNLPQNLWVSRVIASKHNKSRVYATLNGYRNDDFKPYIFVSNNYGNTWQPLHANLPNAPVNVIKEDPKNESILYVGTDNGAFVSLNGGTHWEAFSKNLPPVAVHDLVIQPEANDLILGTHGRSVYTANIEPLQKLNNSNTPKLFTIKPIKYSKDWGNSWSQWFEAKTPEISIGIFTVNSGNYTVKIRSKKGHELKSIPITTEKGYNFITYDLSISEKAVKLLEKEQNQLNIKKAKNNSYYLPKGSYSVEFLNQKTTLEIN